MIRVDLRGDMSVAIRAVGELSDAAKGKAAAHALNRAAVTVRKEASQRIRARYNIDSGRVNRILRIRNANASDLQAVVYAKDRRIALSAFGRASLRRKYERTKAGKAARAISVKVMKGQASKIVTGKPEYAGDPFLMVVGKGEHLGIFQRVGQAKNPFRELMSVSVPGGLATRAIREALVKVASERFTAELTRNLRFRAGQTKKG